MLKIEKIKYCSMRYIFKDGSDFYDCIQVDDTLILSPDKQTIKTTLKSKDNNPDIDSFDIIITKKDNKFWIKSDFFEDETILYPLQIFNGEDEHILVAEFPTEIMYLHVSEE